ncbi:crotonase [Candidatus Bathyarchaeota archaeon]|nr:MAG: crotonase [Candidatus Bathyarchaeota archaeon]
MGSYKTILVEKKDGVAKITLNRPEKLNSINKDVIQDLSLALEDIRKDENVRVVVITGAGDRAFSAGADISMLKEIKTPVEARELIWSAVEKVIRAIENLEKPVIAAVNGLALGGGCELAMACDIIIASDKARFGQPEINLGVLPGWGGMSRLAMIVGFQKAKELVFTGDMISAEEAEKIGLVNKVVPAEKFNEAVDELVNKLLSKSPIALKLAKEAVNRGPGIDVEAALARDRELFALSVSSEDAKEGLSAFLEKRKPVFKGK